MAKSLNRILVAAGKASTLPTVAVALKAWAHIRAEHGYTYSHEANLLQSAAYRNSDGMPGNAKIAKNAVATWTLTLAPASTSGVANTCDKSTAQCRRACVMFTAGRGIMESVRRAHNVRTAFAAQEPDAFLALLGHEVRNLEKRGEPFGLRLNVASDILWEQAAPELFWGSNVRAYDYTKWGKAERTTPNNYRLTYSHNERWVDALVPWFVAQGENVAMVFDTPKHQLPDTHMGLRVIDGDLSDYRYADERGVIVGLAAKGAAKAMTTGGFVTHA